MECRRHPEMQSCFEWKCAEHYGINISAMRNCFCCSLHKNTLNRVPNRLRHPCSLACFCTVVIVCVQSKSFKANKVNKIRVSIRCDMQPGHWQQSLNHFKRNERRSCTVHQKSMTHKRDKDRTTTTTTRSAGGQTATHGIVLRQQRHRLIFRAHGMHAKVVQLVLLLVPFVTLFLAFCYLLLPPPPPFPLFDVWVDVRACERHKKFTVSELSQSPLCMH